SAYLGPAALLVGWTLAGYDASFGRWWAVSLTPLAAAYAFAWRRWLPEAKPFQHLAIVIAAIVMSGEMSAFREWLPWATPVFLLGVGAVYLLDRRLGGDELAADLGFGAVALAFAGFVSDLSWRPGGEPSPACSSQASPCWQAGAGGCSLLTSTISSTAPP